MRIRASIGTFLIFLALLVGCDRQNDLELVKLSYFASLDEIEEGRPAEISIAEVTGRLVHLADVPDKEDHRSGDQLSMMEEASKTLGIHRIILFHGIHPIDGTKWGAVAFTEGPYIGPVLYGQLRKEVILTGR